MTDQPCPLWPYQTPLARKSAEMDAAWAAREPDPLYRAMMDDGILARPDPEFDAMIQRGVIMGGPFDDGVDWPVDSHAARAAHGQRGGAQRQPAGSVVAANGRGAFGQDEPPQTRGAHWDSAAINRRQLVKRLRARW